MATKIFKFQIQKNLKSFQISTLTVKKALKIFTGKLNYSSHTNVPACIVKRSFVTNQVKKRLNKSQTNMSRLSNNIRHMVDKSHYKSILGSNLLSNAWNRIQNTVQKTIGQCHKY